MNELRAFLLPLLTARYPNGEGRLNAAAAATAIGVSYPKFYAWMRGERLPSPGDLDVVLAALDLDVADQHEARRRLAVDDAARA